MKGVSFDDCRKSGKPSTLQSTTTPKAAPTSTSQTTLTPKATTPSSTSSEDFNRKTAQKLLEGLK